MPGSGHYKNGHGQKMVAVLRLTIIEYRDGGGSESRGEHQKGCFPAVNVPKRKKSCEETPSFAPFSLFFSLTIRDSGCELDSEAR